jgi:hypothetical protein
VSINFGTATPTDYKFGTASVSKIYYGSTQVWPVTASTKLTIARSNGSGVTSSFDGDGTLSYKYTRTAGYYIDEVNGMSRYSFTLTSSGTVYMSSTVFDETDSGYYFYYKKNGTTFATSGTGGQITFASSTSGVSGDVFTMASNATGGDLSSQYIYNVSIYAT